MSGVGLLMVLAAAAWIIAAPDAGTLVASRGTAGALAAAGKAAAGKLRSDIAGSRPPGPSWLTSTRTGRMVGRLWSTTRAGSRAARVAGRALAAGAAAAPQGWTGGVDRAVKRRNRYGWPGDLIPRRSVRPRTDAPARDTATPVQAGDPTGPVPPDRQRSPDTLPGPVTSGPDRTDPRPGDNGPEYPREQRTVRLTDGQFPTVHVDTGPARTRFERLLSPEGLARLRLLSAIRDAGYSGWLDHDVRPVPGPNLFTARDTQEETPAGPLEPGTRVCLVDEPSRRGVVIGYAAVGGRSPNVWVMTVEWDDDGYGRDSRHTRDELIVLSASEQDPVLAVVDERGQVLWQRRAVCPECGELVQPAPPRQWVTAHGPRPRWSHLAGEPLCPVMSDAGYQPAEPLPADPNEPGLPGRAGSLGWADLPGSGPLRLVPSTAPSGPAAPSAPESPSSVGVSTTNPIHPSKENDAMRNTSNRGGSDVADVQPISRGDLETIDDLALEVGDAGSVADVANAYLAALADWAASLADRYAGAGFRTAGLSRAVSELLEAIPNPNTVSSLEDAITGVQHEIAQAEALSEAAEILDAEGDLAAFRRA